MRRQGARRILAHINRRGVHGPGATESEHQQAFFHWLTDTELLQTDKAKAEALHWCHHIPSGGGRGKPFITKSGVRLPPLEAVLLKREGVKPGVWDIRLDYHVTCPGAHTDYPETYYGLLIEMKSHERWAKVSEEQKRYQAFMESLGFVCRVRRTWQAAARDLVGYMELERFAPVFVEVERDRLLCITDRAGLLELEAIKG